MRLVAMLVSACVLLSQAGCSFFAGSTVPLTVSCAERDADLFVDGRPVGKGSASTMVARDLNHTVMAKKGERVGTVMVGTKISGLGVLDIIGGLIWLLPFVGLAAPGARSLDQQHVDIVIP